MERVIASKALNALMSEELAYEIKRRGAEPKASVDEKRKQLRKLLREQRRGSLGQVEKVEENISIEEINRIQRTIAGIKQSIEELLDKDVMKHSEKFETRITHYMNRIETWTGDLENLEDTKDECRVTLKECLEVLDAKTDRIEEENLESDYEESNDENEQEDVMSNEVNVSPRIVPEYPRSNINEIPRRISNVRHQVESEERIPRTQSINNLVNRIEVSRYNDQPLQPTITSRDEKLYKWNLKYSGNPSGMSVQYFLEQVEIKRRCRGLSHHQVFMNFHELVSESAALWHTANHKHFNSWYELECKLRQAFSNEEQNIQMWQEVLNYKQGKGEKVIDYISKIKILFDRLPEKMNMVMKVDTIKMNALPKFKERLQQMNHVTVEDVEDAMLTIEKTFNEYQGVDFDREFRLPSSNHHMRQHNQDQTAYDKRRNEPRYNNNWNFKNTNQSNTRQETRTDPNRNRMPQNNHQYNNFAQLQPPYGHNRYNSPYRPRQPNNTYGNPPNRNHERENENKASFQPQRTLDNAIPSSSNQHNNLPKRKIYCFRCGKDGVTIHSCDCKQKGGNG